jgi:hypothetical protein
MFSLVLIWTLFEGFGNMYDFSIQLVDLLDVFREENKFEVVGF